MIISTVSKSHEGFYYCKHSEKGESPKSWISVRERPKAKVSIKPDHHVFRGETVTLRCDIDGEGVTSWQYSWYKDDSNSVFSELQEHTFSPVTESDTGKYSCNGAERGGSRTSNISDTVTLTVLDRLHAVLSVSPQKWLTEGDPVTLICEVYGSSTDWTFSWFTLTASSESSNHYQMLSDSSRGAGGNYTVSSAALKHTGVYVCRAERGKPAYKTTYSNTQPVWVTGVSPRVSLIISPGRTQHFTSLCLSLSCEDQSNSDRWRVRRYTESGQLEDCSSLHQAAQTGSTCTISSTSTSDIGVYWCQSQSGEKYHPVNITVHSGVILESPVHPVIEGDTLTLRCLYQHSTPSNPRADFYKDGSLIQNQTTEMIISTVSKSHEGFYYCKHSERGESPKSWMSVRDFTAPTLTVLPQSSLFTGDSFTLKCEVDQSWDGWEFLWSKNSNTESTEVSNKKIYSVKVSDGGEYRCRARRGRNYTNYSEPVTVTIYGKPKPKVSIKPAQHVFRGEIVTLRCDIDGEGVTSWQYSWYKDDSNSVFSELQEHTFSPVTESDAGKYSCYGAERGGSRTSNISDEVTLTVSDRVQAVLSVSPQKWLTEGDPVTLICEVYGSSTEWTFSWFSVTASPDNKHLYQLLSDSSRGAGGNYTVSSAALKHTGVYVCRAERGEPAYNTTYSNTQEVWVTGVSPRVSLIISPNRTQHFTSVSLSLSCEDQSNSDRWRVRRYTQSWGVEDSSSLCWASQTGSTCTINSTNTSDTGVYWCQSESGEKYHPVNITVHSGVILESPVHPVTEGDTLTLRCLYQHSTPPNLRADFYKDGSLIQNQTTEMIISTVSKSHEGFYYCKHSERGESPKSWISVIETPKAKVNIKPAQYVFRGETVTLRCDIDGEGVTSWLYVLQKYGAFYSSSELQEHTFSSVTESDAGKYYCYGAERGGSRTSNISDEVTLTVSDRAQAGLSISPQKWLTEGDSVTLICEVYGSSTDWTFSWFSVTVSSYNRYNFQLLSDSSRGAGGNYTVSSAALKHTGVYVCRAERGEPAYNTTYSNTQPVWVTGISPRGSLIISPGRNQHFTFISFSLSCEDQSNSDRWRVRRYTESKQLEDCSSSLWGSQTATCTINSTITSDTGVYWCQSESGEKYHPVNITVHSGVILESPVHPLTEGDTLTLHCLYQHSTPPNLRADFYKDGSLIQNQTTEMIISTVSKSHEGFYYCKHSERGESPKSWISVRDGVILESPVHPVTEGDTLTLRCLYQHSTPPNLRADFYKDGSLIQSQTTEMIISTVSKSHEGFYYCKHSERGESPKSWISVRDGVILESPVHPVTEGDTLTLHCLYQQSTPPNPRADFYKDGSLIQNQTTEMIISTVSKSHEGFYYCKHSERGESPKSWISVRASSRTSRSEGFSLVIIGVTAGLTISIVIIVFLVLLWRYRNKGVRSQSPSSVSQQKNCSQTSEQNQSDPGNNTLLSDHVNQPIEHIYTEIELKSPSLLVKTSESSDTVYSKLTLVTHQAAGSNDLMDAQVK
ncbi:basement membrane-specific heparan sulfate proteoglycan core protein [Carassius gibelio]|uniref:basement membrane-specific heparan sulfate proteoglycan core protein n=1 Tax=Carassius gibelio TaxID=101364 RepID=UPI0022775684|nr:basement membrane-specific heparan sulfate proteoglycan core protein [Carassius gibelio]